MRKTPANKKGRKNRPKTKLGIPDLEHSKAAVLRSFGSPDSVRGCQLAISRSSKAREEMKNHLDRVIDTSRLS
jgi:hypothetical protein